MAVRVQSFFKSSVEVQWRIDLHDTEYVGDPLEMLTGDMGFELKYDNGGLHECGLMPSSLTWPLLVYSDGQTLVDDILDNGDEMRFTVAVYKNGVFWWAGGLVSDAKTYEDIDYPYMFSLVATCGLGLLKEKLYDVGEVSVSADTRISLRRVVGQILSLTPGAQLYGSSAAFVRFCTSIREDSFSSGTTATSLDASVRKRLFFDISDTGTRMNLPGAEWLLRIMELFLCRVYMSGGMWVVEEVPFRRISTQPAALMSKNLSSMVGVSSTDYNVSIAAQGSNAARLTGGSWGLYPTLVRCAYKYITQRYLNMLQGVVFNTTSYALKDTGFEVETLPLVTTMRIRGVLSANVKNVDLNNPPAYALEYRATIKIAGQYYCRDRNIAGSQITYSMPYWSATAGYYWYVHGFNQGPALGATNTVSIYFDVSVPNLAAAGEFSFQMRMMSARRGNNTQIDPASYVVTWAMAEPSAYVFQSGYYETYDSATVTVANNTDYSGNSERVEVEGYMGDGPETMSVGALATSNGSGWNNTTLWTANGVTTGVPLAELMVGERMRMRRKPLRLYFGDLYCSNIEAHSRIELTDDAYYLVGAGTYVANYDEWRGVELFEIYRYEGGVVIDTEGGSGNLVAPPVVGLVAESIIDPKGNSLLAQAFQLTAFAATTVDLEAGPVTQLDVSSALKAKSLKAGGKVLLINPALGYGQTLTVAADVEDGDTTIDVTGTDDLLLPYDEGALLVAAPSDNFVQSGVGNGAATAAVTYPTYNSNAAAIADGAAVGTLYIAGSEHEAAAQGTVMAVF